MTYYNVKEVAARYGVTTQTLHRWRRLGKFLEPIETGNAVRWTSEALDAWDGKRGATKSSTKTNRIDIVVNSLAGLIETKPELSMDVFLAAITLARAAAIKVPNPIKTTTIEAIRAVMNMAAIVALRDTKTDAK